MLALPLSGNEIQSSLRKPYMCAICCSRTSTHYSERQMPVVSLSSALSGWNFLLMRRHSATTRRLWLETVSWCKEYTLRSHSNNTQLFYLCIAVPFLWFPLNVTEHLLQRAKHVSVYLPGDQSWYDMKTGTAYKGGATHKLEALEESIPSFQRAGTIIPRKDRFRRSSTQMENDPYTLVCLRITISCSFSSVCQ